MVKVRPGLRKGRTKLVRSAYKAARKRAARQGKSFQRGRYVVHNAMRSAWDENRSAAGNLSRLGLCASVNLVHKSPCTSERKINMSNQSAGDGEGNERGVSVNDAKGQEVRMQLEQCVELGERAAKKVVHPGERIALQRLVAKYGDDWIAMSRDIKLNYLQWTPAQLQKKIERMHSILESEKINNRS